MTVHTVAKYDSTGYALEVVATEVPFDLLPGVITTNANPWALFQDFIVFSESDPHSRPRRFRVIPGSGSATVTDRGPALQDPLVNGIWNRLIAESR